MMDIPPSQTSSGAERAEQVRVRPAGPPGLLEPGDAVRLLDRKTADAIRQLAGLLPEHPSEHAVAEALHRAGPLPALAVVLIEAEAAARAGQARRALDLLLSVRVAPGALVDCGLHALAAAAEQSFDAALAGGDAARDARDWPRATEHYELALALRPAATFVRVQLGHALKEQGRLDQAGQAYGRASEETPQDDDVFLHLGHVSKLMGDPVAAAEAYRTALRLNPANADARVELAGLGFAPASLADAAGAVVAASRYAVRFDGAQLGRLRGWVVDMSDPGRPVVLELVHARQPILTFLADQPRADLADQHGSPLHGFDVHLPALFADGILRLFDIRAAADGTPLVEGVAIKHRRTGAPSVLFGLQRTVEAVRRQIAVLESQIGELMAGDSIALEDYALFADRYAALDAEERAAVLRGGLPSVRTVWLGAGGLGAGKGGDTGEDVVLFVAEGAEPTRDAATIAAASFAAASEAVLLYGDHGSRDASGAVAAPCYKPDFDPLLLLQRDYIGPIVAVRREALAAAGGLEAEAGPDALRGLALRLAAAHPAERFLHVPRVLGHLAAGAAPPAGGEGPPRDWQQELDALGVRSAALVERDGADRPRLRLLPARAERISIIIASKDQSPLLAQCLYSILGRTSGVDYEVLVVDHASAEGTFRRLREILAADPRVRFVDASGPFNWARLNNEAAAAAEGSLLLFLNNDTMAIHEDWLARMAGYLGFPGVAAVGPKLLYADGRVQHAGVVLGQGGGTGHYFLGLEGEDPGYLGLAGCAREVSAVTGAAMLVERAAFEALGGFDEAAFPVAFNDVDFCLRLRRAGRRVVYAGDVRLFHLESRSRGADLAFAKAEQQRRELWTFRTRWDVEADPFYNCNFDRQAPAYARLRPPRPLTEWLAGLGARA